MKYLLRVILTLVFICAVSMISAGLSYGSVGTSAITFLNIDCGTRAVGMAGAGGAATQDATAMYWNPAGLTEIYYSAVHFMHAEYLEGVRYEYLAYGMPLGGNQWLGASVSYLDSGKMTRTTEDENGILVSEDAGTFKLWDLMLSAGYARRIGYHWRLGITGKLFHEDADSARVTSGAFDFGAIYRLNPDASAWLPQKVSLSLHNLGPNVKFIEASEKLPLLLRIGTLFSAVNFKQEYEETESYTSEGVRVRPKRLNVAFDVNISMDNNPVLNLGGEFWAFRILAVRAGYKYRIAKADLGYLAGLSTGLGLNISPLSIDFGFMPQGDLGQTYRISVGWQVK